MTDKTQGIKTVLEALLKGGQAEGQLLYAQIYDEEIIQKARNAAQSGNPERFFFALGYQLQKVIDAVVEGEFPQNQNAQFLMANAHFIESHLDKIFTKFEGMACSHDKTKTVMKALLRFFTTEKRIEFNYDGEYTYHLPKKVLRDHDSIIAYFTGLHHLYYGNPDRYLVAMQGIIVQAAAHKAASVGEDE